MTFKNKLFSLKVAVILSALTVFAIACAGTKEPAEMPGTSPIVADNAAPIDELDSARKIYANECIKCHKETGTGGLVDDEGKRIKVPDLTSEKKAKLSDEDYIDAIENGYPEDGMPAFKDKLTKEQIDSLIAMIRKDFQKK